MGPAPTIRGIAYGLGGIALLMAALEIAGSIAPGREAGGASDALGAELQRCRDLTPENVDDVAWCRDAWAESRRRFFGATIDGRD